MEAAVRAAAVRFHQSAYGLEVARDALEVENGRLAADRQELTSQVFELRTTLEAFQARLAFAEAEGRRVSEQLRAVSTEHAMVLDTTSWRWTRPLRGAATAARRFGPARVHRRR